MVVHLVNLWELSQPGLDWNTDHRRRTCQSLGTKHDFCLSPKHNNILLWYLLVLLRITYLLTLLQICFN